MAVASTEKVATFPVAEIFGPTIQGEGPLVGSPCHFIRFAGCDFKCTWCDTPYAVNVAEVRKAPKLTADQILERIDELEGAPRWIILSGGNPCLHKLDDLITRLRRRAWLLQVETQGTLWKPWLRYCQRIVVSPKPPSAEQPQTLAVLDKFLSRCNQMNVVSLKVVVFDDRDYEFAREVHKAYPKIEFFLSVGDKMGGLTGGAFGGVKDEDSDRRTRLRWLMERVASDTLLGSVRVLPQVHKLAWSDSRGH